MTRADLYQRQLLLNGEERDSKALLPTDAKEYYVEDDKENTMQIQDSCSDSSLPNRRQTRFPEERWKTFVALMLFLFTSLVMFLTLAKVHDIVPDRKLYAPLPDVFFDYVDVRDWAIYMSEYLMVIAVHSNLVIMLLHKHRFIVLRRFFVIISILYLYRSLSFYVTVLPMANQTYHCSPKSNYTTVFDLARRVYDMSLGLGLAMNGKQTYCGDYIFSGHTLTFVLCYLMISEYTPKKLYLIHWFYWLLGIVGACMLLVSRYHYTVDIILAYYVTTRLFWIYHTLANNATLKQRSKKNLLTRVWWFKFFLYLEGNIDGQIPRQWPDWPFLWPKLFQTKTRDTSFL